MAGTVQPTPPVPPRRDAWWRGAVIYQIYPRSFQDTTGNGVGDLAGITRRLEHARDLGVDAVWVSPFMKSPMKDFGYDVADYRAVDPLFGTLEDFDALLAKAHALGLKLLIDFVPSHTSDQHPWFQEARTSRDNPKADWYVFADPKPDGTPPNNWLSVFGGPAWHWEPRRGQYYLHNFLKEQPDLNFHNPEVIDALLDEARFWLDRGVDGFRLDAVDFGVHDPELRDNPPRPEGTSVFVGSGTRRVPFSMQYQTYNHARPELEELFFKPLYRLTEEYEGRAILAEVTLERALERKAAYTAGGGVDMAYSFDLLRTPPTAAGVRSVIEAFEGHGRGWPCWSLSNHDVPRAVTRFGGDAPTDDLAALLPIMLLSLRGSLCLYQGEELGLEEAALAYEDIQDPVGLTFWPEDKGRDGARTPMPWEHAAPYCGYSEARPWLPIPEAHRRRAVDRQAGVAESVLERVRAFARWRQGQPSLRTGGIRFLDTPGDVLAFERHAGEARTLCAFNLGATPQRLALGETLSPLDCPIAGGTIERGRLDLPAHRAHFARLG